MTARRIGSDGCALVLLLLALSTLFVFGSDLGRFERYGPCQSFCFGDGNARHFLTIAANLSPAHGFLGFYHRYLNEDGEIAYEVHNRFPLGGFLLIKAAMLPFPDDRAAQIRAARTLMLAFLAAAAVAAFLSLRRLTSSSGVALAATLLAFSSFYPLFFGDMVATDGPIDLFAVLLTFHGMVVFAQEGRFRQLLVKTCGALLVGWHVYGLLLPFIAFGLASEWRRGDGRGLSRAARLVRSRHVALGVAALSFGLLVLSFNFAREHYALNRVGPRAPGGDEVTLAELPSFRSMVRRMGWGAEHPAPWSLLLRQFLWRAGRASIPYVAEHVVGSRPRTSRAVTSERTGSPATTPAAIFSGERERGGGWKRIAASFLGGIVVLCAGAGLAFVRHRVLLATLAASGFCWGALVPGTVVYHPYEGMFLVGLPLVFFSVVLLKARRVSERSVGVCAGAALLVFVLSGVQMGRFETALTASDVAADYEKVRAVAPEGAVILAYLGERVRARFFLTGRIFGDDLNGRQRHRADFVLSPERIPDGAGLLTPDNRRAFLYDRAEYDAQYVTLGDPVLEGGRGWRVHRVGNRLIYTTGAACATGSVSGTNHRFLEEFLDFRGRILRRREIGSFRDRAFEVAGRCMVETFIPEYAARIRTGRFVRGAGPLWSAEVPLPGDRRTSPTSISPRRQGVAGEIRRPVPGVPARPGGVRRASPPGGTGVDAGPHSSDDARRPPGGDGGRRVAEFGEDRRGVFADLGDGVHAGFGAVGDRRRQGRPQRSRARRHLAPAVPGPELRMFGELRDGVHAAAGDPRRVEPGDDLLRRQVREHLADGGLQRIAVGHPPGVGVEARIGRQRRPFEHLGAEADPLALVLQPQEHRLAVGALERAVGCDGGVPRAAARRRRAPVQRVVEREAHPFAERFQHRDLDGRALAAPLASEEGGQHPRPGVHAGRDVGDRDRRLHHLVRGAGDRHQPRLGLHQQVVGLLVAVGAGGAVTGDVADDEPRPPGAQRPGVEPEPVRRAGREVLHEDVRPVDQLRHHLARLGTLEIEGQRLLRAVEPDEVARQPLDRRVVAAGEVADDGALHLDDPRPEVGELPRGERRRHRLFQGDDRHAVERTGHQPVSMSRPRVGRAGRGRRRAGRAAGEPVSTSGVDVRRRRIGFMVPGRRQNERGRPSTCSAT